MRRSSRNIETFDISLMAVVTKAMGAFLVMMLLLMPYYSSGPIGQQQAADLASQIEQINQKINEVMNRLANASPEDLRKLLEEALRRLEEARRLLTGLKRANDALQAQARRLEEQVASLQAEVQKLNEEINRLKGNSITAVIANLECKERVWLDIYRGDDQVILPDNSKTGHVLNYSGPPGSRGVASNFGYFSVRGLNPTTYYLTAKVLRSDAKVETMRSGGKGYRLKRSTSDCSIHAGLDVALASGKTLIWKLDKTDIKQGQYARVLGELVLTADNLDWKPVSDTSAKWLADQVSNAEKED